MPVLEIRWASAETTTHARKRRYGSVPRQRLPDKGLAPPANALSPARADYLQMLHFGGSWIDMMLWQIRIHEHLLRRDQSDGRTIQRYRSKLVNEVDRNCCSGLRLPNLSAGLRSPLPTRVIGHNVAWARRYGLCQDELFGSYISRLARREGFRKAFADAQNFSLSLPARQNT